MLGVLQILTVLLVAIAMALALPLSCQERCGSRRKRTTRCNPSTIQVLPLEASVSL